MRMPIQSNITSLYYVFSWRQIVEKDFETPTDAFQNVGHTVASHRLSQFYEKFECYQNIHCACQYNLRILLPLKIGTIFLYFNHHMVNVHQVSFNTQFLEWVLRQQLSESVYYCINCISAPCSKC